MAIRDIIMDTDPLLRKKSRDVISFDSKLHKLLDDMLETMDKYEGIGLAAPQVGILRRVAIMRDQDENIIEFINPVIIDSDGEQKCSEGCLSVKDRRHNVMRPMTITVKAYDRNGVEFEEKYEGLNANICCHEFDHLNGILFYDRMIVEDEIEEVGERVLYEEDLLE